MNFFTKFSALDLFFFVIVITLSLAIGLYHGYRSRKIANTREEYLLGGRTMGLFPVTASLVATAVSGSTLLGQTAEVYAYGTQAWLLWLGCFVMSMIVPVIFLPVFLEIGDFSSFKYLELRFSRSLRLFASCLYTITSLLYLPVTVYVPALAFHEVTGLSVHLTTGVLTLLCVTYTAFGGIKAVVWTDVFQITLTLISTVIVMLVGVNQSGGLENVWKTADRGKRLVFFNFDPDPTVRSTFWQYMFSMIFVVTYQFGINQTNIQRFLALSNLRKMHLAIGGLTISFAVIMTISQTIGATIYTTYETCDPFSAGVVRKVDQILPHFIEQKTALFPGFTGIFIAGIFAASLSSTSSFLNTLSGSIYNDFLARRLRKLSEASASNVVKILVVILGIAQMILLLVVEKLGTIFSMTAQCMAIATSALLGLFTLGMLCRRVNTTGALCGSLASLAVVLVLIIGGQYREPDPFLPLRTDGCNSTDFNITFSRLTTAREIPKLEGSEEKVPWIFRIHFLYHALVGFSVNMIVGLVVSYLTGGCPSVDEKLLATFLRRKQEKSEEEIELKVGKEDENGKNHNS
ncbi:hypothetical protein DMENIID0001_029610 [Sergentomyia squamirostris]